MQVERGSAPLKLGTESISKLLMEYSIPAVIAMVASSVYHITDSAFIGHGVENSALALSGLGITFPLMNLATAFGALIGVGASTLLSIRLGQKDYASANRILGNVVMLNLILGLAFALGVYLFLDPILYLFGASAETIGFARDFMEVILFGNVITHMYLGLNAMMRSAGMPKQAMYATVATVVINLILNPLFIFGFKWGVQGSALATVISQFIVLLWQFRLFMRKDSFLRLQKKNYRVDFGILVSSFSIGLSPFLMNVAACFVSIVMNREMITYGGDLAVGALNIVYRCTFFFFMIVVGVNQGFQPIAGYNFGAQRIDRLKEAYWKTVRIASSIMTTGLVLILLFAEEIVAMFTTEPELYEMAVHGMRLSWFMSPLIGAQMVSSVLFQSIGEPGKSIFISLMRQVIFLIPLMIFLPTIWGIDGVWLSMPIADFLSVMVTSVLVYFRWKKFNQYAEINC